MGKNDPWAALVSTIINTCREFSVGFDKVYSDDVTVFPVKKNIIISIYHVTAESILFCSGSFKSFSVKAHIKVTLLVAFFVGGICLLWSTWHHACLTTSEVMHCSYPPASSHCCPLLPTLEVLLCPTRSGAQGSAVAPRTRKPQKSIEQMYDVIWSNWQTQKP